MSSDIRYTFFAEYVENVKYLFTPRLLGEFKVSCNIFFKKSICCRETHLVKSLFYRSLKVAVSNYTRSPKP